MVAKMKNWFQAKRNRLKAVAPLLVALPLLSLFQNCEQTPRPASASRAEDSDASMVTPSSSNPQDMGAYALKAELENYATKTDLNTRLSTAGGAVNGNLTVTGNVTVQGSVSTKPDFFMAVLSGCGGACNDALNVDVWYNASVNKAWKQRVNTNSEVFQLQAPGQVLIRQAGTYEIKLFGLFWMKPDQAADRVQAPVQTCLFINQSPNCGHLTWSQAVRHGFFPPAVWHGIGPIELILQLEANTVLGYGIAPRVQLQYWGHDDHNAIQIRRL